MTKVTTGIAGSLILCASIAGAQTQSFRFDEYPTGPHAYDFPDRDRISSLLIMEQRRRDEMANRDNQSNGDGAGGTIAVGNWQQFYLIVGNNSEGVINNSSPQSDFGTQTATSNVNSQNSAGDQMVRNGSDWHCAVCTAPAPQSWKWGHKAPVHPSEPAIAQGQN
jgi:hypothetical protein